MQQGIPDTPSRYAEEGTQAHAEAERHLNAWLTTKIRPSSENEAIQLYLDHCLREAAVLTQPAVRVELKLVLDQDMNMFGTADFLATSLSGDAVIVDLKYGKGVPVSADSPQLAYYAVALWRTSSRKLTLVKVKVVQPRFSIEERRVSEKTYELDDLRNWYAVLTRGAERALLELMLKKPTLAAGKWCQFCKAKKTCETYSANPIVSFARKRVSAQEDFEEYQESPSEQLKA